MKTDSCVNHDINLVTLLGSIHQEDGIITYKQIVEKKKKKKTVGNHFQYCFVGYPKKCITYAYDFRYLFLIRKVNRMTIIMNMSHKKKINKKVLMFKVLVYFYDMRGRM